MLLADCADLADVIDKADVSFRCSVALADTDVSEALQEVGPGVGPYPVPKGQAHLMVAVRVTLQGKRKRRNKAPNNAGCQTQSSPSISFTKESKVNGGASLLVDHC